MAQSRGTFSQLHDNTDYRKVYTLLGTALRERPAIWTKYYNQMTSDRKTEITQSYVEMGDVPTKAEGATYTTDLIRPAWQKSVTHTEFGLGFEVTETALEDDRFNVLKRNTQQLAYSARYVLEKQAAAPLNNGFSSELASDGVAWFSASHALASGSGTQRNILNPGQDLSWNSLTQAVIDQQNQTKTEGGRFVDVVESWDLVVPPDLEFTAHRIVNSTLLPGIADNDVNALKQRRRFNIIVNPHLTDTDAWVLLASDSSRHGLSCYKRRGITLVTPMVDPRTGNVLYKVRMRYSWFVDAWQNAFASQGA